MDSPLPAVAHRFRELRRDLGESQAQFAARFGMHEDTIRRYEAGELPDVLRVFAELCRLTGSSADYLLGLRDNRSGLPAGHFVVDMDAYERPAAVSDGRPVFVQLPANARLVDATNYLAMRRELEQREQGK